MTTITEKLEAFNTDEFNIRAGLHIPAHMHSGIALYVERHIPPGGFFTAVLENNLSETVGRADHINIKHLPAYCSFIYNYIPSNAWGSPEKVAAWLNQKI